MSVLQCASLALKATVRELESSKSPSRTRLHSLRQKQMMEILECLLQMGSYLHTMVWISIIDPRDFGLLSPFYATPSQKKKSNQNCQIVNYYAVVTENYPRASGHFSHWSYIWNAIWRRWYWMRCDNLKEKLPSFLRGVGLDHKTHDSDCNHPFSITDRIIFQISKEENEV